MPAASLHHGFLCLLLGCASLHAEPAMPFPQADKSTRLSPPSVSQTTLNRACQKSWDVIREQLIATDGCESGEMRVIVDAHDFEGGVRPTYSEGIGWGMLFAAIMDREQDSTQKIFDGLNAYRKRYLMPSGFMNWRILANGEIGGQGVAVEAEENIAMGLLLAHMQWGSTREKNYLEEFRHLARELRARCLIPEKNLLKPGDVWGGEDLLHPANWKPAFWRVWEVAVPDPAWAQVRESTAELMLKVAAISPSGLPPHWCRSDATPTGANTPYFADYTFEYDALQLPIHNALHIAWYGVESAAADLAMNQKISAWLNAKPEITPATILDGYTLEGEPTGKYRNPAFLASFMAAVASSGKTPPEQNPWLDALLEMPPEKDGYYGALIRLYALLIISGNFPNVPEWLKINLRSDPAPI